MMAKLSCSANLLKFLLFLGTLFVFLVGGALLAIGIIVRVDPEAMAIFQVAAAQNEDDELLSKAAMVLAVVGAITFVIGFVGCCGACKENTWLLIAFSIMVSCVVLLQICVGVIAGVATTRLGMNLKSAMINQVTRQYNEVSQLSQTWDAMQIHMECCGADKAQDWYLSQWQKPLGYKTPRSCCVLIEKDINKCCENDDNVKDVQGCQSLTPGAYHETGCYFRVRDWLRNNANILMAIAFGLIIVEIAAIFAACCLSRSIIKSQDAAAESSAELSMNATLNSTTTGSHVRYPQHPQYRPQHPQNMYQGQLPRNYHRPINKAPPRTATHSQV